jgi:hypothetical protein
MEAPALRAGGLKFEVEAGTEQGRKWEYAQSRKEADARSGCKLGDSQVLS